MSKLVQGVNDLETWCKENNRQDLLSEWDYDKNGSLKPNNFSKFSNRKVWWLCKNGHSYDAQISNRVKNHSGCPFCSNPPQKVLSGFNDLSTKYPMLLSEWDFEKNENISPETELWVSHKNVWWICPKGHSYDTKINYRTKNNVGCPICSNHKLLVGYNDLETRYPEIAKEWHPTLNGDLKPNQVISGEEVWWLCPKGHTYETKIRYRISKDKQGCPYCANKKVLVGYNDLATSYPDLLKEWDFDKNKEFSPQDITYGSSKKVWWVCQKGHSFYSTIHSRTTNQSQCPYCTNKKVLVDYNDLATSYPDLLKEWDYAKNGDLKPQDVSKGSKKKVWWLCPQGHSYESSICTRTQGCGCPICSGQQVLVGFNDIATTHPHLLQEWNYAKNGDLKPQQVTSGSRKKVWWTCHQGHSYESLVCSRTRDRDCPYCSGRKVLDGYNDLATTKPELAKEWDYEKNGDLTPQMVTKGSNKKVWWLCPQGHSFEASINNRARGSDCPYCKQRTNKVIEGFNDLESQYPNVAKEWHPTLNGNLKPNQVIAGSDKKVWWICDKGHAYKKGIYSKVKGIGCPYCSNTLVLSGFNDLVTKYPDIAKEWHPTLNGNTKPSDVTGGTHKKYWWLCPNGHSYEMKPNSRTNPSNKSGCPYCSGSKTERLLYDLLKQWNIPYQAEKKFDNATPIEIQFYPYDIYVSKYRLIIEADGMQHFKDMEYFNDTPFEERVRRDNVKNQYCSNLLTPIPILRIPYTYNPNTDSYKIGLLVKEFIETRKVPQEILDFYKPYKDSIGSNYYDIATKMNEIKWNGYE